MTTPTATPTAAVPGCIIGAKVNDQNVHLPGWVIRTQRNDASSPVYETMTDQGGFFVFPILPPGHWLVWEVMQPGWAPLTAPNFTVNVPPGPGCVSVRFMNQQKTD